MEQKTKPKEFEKRVSLKNFFKRRKLKVNQVDSSSKVKNENTQKIKDKPKPDLGSEISKADISGSSHKKVFYSEKQSEIINGIPAVPPCSPG